MPYWTERFCKYGHDTSVVGRTGDRFCKACRQAHDRIKYERRKRTAEIASAKHVLIAAHRLRAIGVVPRNLGPYNYSSDSWRVQ